VDSLWRFALARERRHFAHLGAKTGTSARALPLIRGAVYSGSDTPDTGIISAHCLPILHPGFKYLAILVTALLLGGLLLAFLAQPEPRPSHPYFGAGEFLVIAHRGGPELGPEGTLPAFRRAVDLGVDVLDMDVRPSADGALVVFHDSRVDRTTDGQGRVDSLTLARLRELDAGYRWRAPDGTYPYQGRGLRIPTLEEVFAAFPGQRLLVEIKSEQASVARDLCGSVRAHGKQAEVVVASFHGGSMQAFRNACPEVATSASPGEFIGYWLLHLARLDGLYSPDFQVFQMPARLRGLTLVDRRFVERARARNLPVHVWTVNRKEEMEHLLDLGVDGIITDRPGLLLDLLRQRNRR